MLRLGKGLLCASNSRRLADLRSRCPLGVNEHQTVNLTRSHDFGSCSRLQGPQPWGTPTDRFAYKEGPNIRLEERQNID